MFNKKLFVPFLFLIVINLILLVIAIEIFKDNKTEFDKVNAKLSMLTDMPLAYAETPTGLKLVPAALGVSKRELDFLKRFRGPLLPLDTKISKFKSGELTEKLRTQTLVDFVTHKNFLMDYFNATERQALIAFALLRTNGSIPTYEVRADLPAELQQLVLGASGNCSDYSVRLMMLLESLGLRTLMISNVTKNLSGHVFVDAYDPQEDTSYLLDANFNVMIPRVKSNNMGFIEQLLRAAEARKDFSLSVKIIVFPVYFRFLDPGNTAFKTTPLTPEFLNSFRASRESLWQKWLANDIDELALWWQKTPSHSPKKLLKLLPIPPEFKMSAIAVKRLEETAVLRLEQVRELNNV